MSLSTLIGRGFVSKQTLEIEINKHATDASIHLLLQMNFLVFPYKNIFILLLQKAKK